jgi:hypothetical protein
MDTSPRDGSVIQIKYSNRVYAGWYCPSDSRSRWHYLDCYGVQECKDEYDNYVQVTDSFTYEEHLTWKPLG